MNKEIGVVQLWYNTDGKAVKGRFDPAVANYEDCISELISTTTGNDRAKIIQDSETVLGNWFNQISDIELADRDQYKISSSIEQCVTWANGNVQYCRMRFYLQKIN